jgi:putative membrane protein
MARYRSLTLLVLSAIVAFGAAMALFPGTSSANPEAAGRRAGDGQALATLIVVDQHEIDAAKQALAKGVTGPVRDFALKMQSEHGQNLADTRRLAREEKVLVDANTEVETLRAKTRSERLDLQKLKGAAYAKAYVDAMVKGHADVLALLDQQLIGQSVDAKVIAHLKATRAHVAEHLAAAKALQK